MLYGTPKKYEIADIKVEGAENYVFGTAAELTVRLMECGTARRYRVVNIAGDEPLSKYETARRIIRAQGMDESLIVPVAMKDSPVFREKRASETILDNSLAKRLLHLDSITMRFI